MFPEYIVEVMEISYVDNWEEGEIEHSCEIHELETSSGFKTPEEALQWFANKYGPMADSKMHKLCFDGRDTQFAFNASRKLGQHGWEKLTPEDEELWKKDRLDVFDVEWAAHIIKREIVSDVNENALPFPIEEV